MRNLIEHLIQENKNFVIIGEPGSGKTEVALTLATEIAKQNKCVHYFDMDQTKTMFRARDYAECLKESNISFHYEEQHLDTPVVASGVIELLMDKDVYVIMDIGGGSHGSHMIGQFAHVINQPNSAALYLLNPYRIWSQNVEDLMDTLSKIKKSARINEFIFVANPNLGKDTTAEDVVKGNELLQNMLNDPIKISFTCVQETLYDELKDQLSGSVLPITLHQKSVF